MKRKRMKRSTSRRLFRRTASKTNRRNLQRGPMRGGWRL